MRKKWHKSIQYFGNFTINWCLFWDIRLPGQKKCQVYVFIAEFQIYLVAQITAERFPLNLADDTNTF